MGNCDSTVIPCPHCNTNIVCRPCKGSGRVAIVKGGGGGVRGDATGFGANGGGATFNKNCSNCNASGRIVCPRGCGTMSGRLANKFLK